MELEAGEERERGMKRTETYALSTKEVETALLEYLDRQGRSNLKKPNFGFIVKATSIYGRSRPTGAVNITAKLP